MTTKRVTTRASDRHCDRKGKVKEKGKQGTGSVVGMGSAADGETVRRIECALLCCRDGGGARLGDIVEVVGGAVYANEDGVTFAVVVVEAG
jgi:hypothetical protein